MCPENRTKKPPGILDASLCSLAPPSPLLWVLAGFPLCLRVSVLPSVIFLRGHFSVLSFFESPRCLSPPPPAAFIISSSVAPSTPRLTLEACSRHLWNGEGQPVPSLSEARPWCLPDPRLQAPPSRREINFRSLSCLWLLDSFLASAPSPGGWLLQLFECLMFYNIRPQSTFSLTPLPPFRHLLMSCQLWGAFKNNVIRHPLEFCSSVVIDLESKILIFC